ncbi:unnamed protein product [Moneuplotes crassus]|uniref:EamA domain-containing protein n=1 Tax=Euplotes crassus TaxID=5936 RepID=A0AAD1XI51_EUPCR|nr:unnamed protein product [Moneuplotes crassus]
MYPDRKLLCQRFEPSGSESQESSHEASEVEKRLDFSESLQVEDLDFGKGEGENSLKGILYMVLCAFCFAGVGFVIKCIYHNYTEVGIFDILLIRCCLTTIVYYFVAKVLKVNLFEINPGMATILMLRVFLGIIAIGSLVASMRYLPASIAMMIYNINPILVMILAYFMLSEQLNLIKIVCCFGAFAGIVIIGLGRNENSQSEGEILGILLASIACISDSFSFTLTRKLNLEIHYILNPYYLSLGCLLTSVLVPLFYSDLLHPENYSVPQILLCLSDGILALLAYLFLSLAYKHTHASTVSPLIYLDSLLNLPTDILYFSYSFYITDLVGSVLCFICVLVPVIRLLCRPK